MAKNNEKTYWPHMIVGFLAVGITLGYWTIKSAASMPVQESNQYMLKYQMADIHINEIMGKKAAFDKEYVITMVDVEMMTMTDNINSNRPQPNAVTLVKGLNQFSYSVNTKDAKVVSDANVTFLLTQPHSRKEDKLFVNIPYIDGKYQIKGVDIQKPGRYTLQFRAEVADTMGYSAVAAYLKP
jgi:hypothetical protein